MNQESQKSKTFVERLLANPSLNDLNPVQKELQIIQFLSINKQQLHPTLSSGNFFPGKPWNEIFSLLYSALVEVINASLFSCIGSILQSEVDYSFFSYLDQPNIQKENITRSLETFIQKMLENLEVRKEYSVILTILTNEYIDQYIREIFETKSYIFFELTKVQKLKMSSNEIINMIKLSLMLRPVIHYFNNGTFHTDSAVVLIPLQYARNILPGSKQQLPGIPDELITSAINSNVSFLDNQYLEATARITSVLSLMFKSVKPDIKVDRGAVSPHKSWINVARRNYKFLGLDIKMLDEFYKHAAENNW